MAISLGILTQHFQSNPYLRDSLILRWAKLCWQQKHQQMVDLSDTWVPQIRYLIITLSSFSRSKLPFFQSHTAFSDVSMLTIYNILLLATGHG